MRPRLPPPVVGVADGPPLVPLDWWPTADAEPLPGGSQPPPAAINRTPLGPVAPDGHTTMARNLADDD